jgi:predicted outer membrane repeat protein
MKRSWISLSLVLVICVSFTLFTFQTVQGAASILYVKPNGITTWPCGDTWANACDLQTALTHAVSGNELWLAAGTYTPSKTGDRSATFQLKNGVAVYGGFVGTETTRDQRSARVNVVTLSGDIGATGNASDNSYHVVTGATGATLEGVTITAGNAVDDGVFEHGNGGGMYNSSSSPTLRDVHFKNNTAYYGGGMYNNNMSSPTLTNVTFSGNASSRYGGGMTNIGLSSPVMTNVTFSSNSAGLYGGAICNYHSNPILTNVTISGNWTSDFGGAMANWTDSAPKIRNSIIWGNSAPHSSYQIYDNTATTTVTYSVVQGGVSGTGNTSANPLLGTLGNYGGSTPTVPLLPGSSAINAGSTTYCTIGYDQRGVNYVGTCDMGAFESRGFALTKTGGDNQSAALNTAFAIPLSVTLTPNDASEPIAGGKITFTPPASGATATISGSPVTLDASGTASVTATATGLPGSYNVIASAAGTADVSFALSNFSLYLHAIPGGATSGYCESWANACELHYALTTATSGQEIWVKAGTHFPTSGTDRNATFQLKNGVTVYGGFAGAETSRDQRNPMVNIVTLSGDIGVVGDASDNSFHVVTGATGATLINVIISGGNASSGNCPGTSCGGGMYNYNGSNPTLMGVFINGNSAKTGGGGMYNDASSPQLLSVTFDGNSTQGLGGAMYDISSSPTLDGVFFSNNSANDSGGAMYNRDNSSPALTQVVFSNNTAVNMGGAIYNYNSSSPALTRVTFNNNSAASGGGIRNYYSSPTLTNVTFSSNTASGAGGGIYNIGGSSPTLTNVTFSSNTAPTGGGIHNSTNCNPQVRNSIFWGNTGGQITNFNNSNPSVTYSIIQGGWGGTVNISLDPLLGVFGDYGSSTQTIPLLPGSSAIDAGSAAYCTLGYDQRGMSYVNACDIGAFESQGFTVGGLTGNNQSAIIETAFAAPLGLTVTANNSLEPVAGGQITFTPPASGASAAITSSPATIDAGGTASVTATANALPGSYSVTASTTGASNATFNLTNLPTILYAIPGGATSGMCESWANACELRYALPNSAAGQEIWVKTGTYQPTSDTDRSATFLLKNGVAVYGGFVGSETARDQRDLAANLVTLSGDIGTPGNAGDNSYHVVTGATGATLDGVTISGGNANGSGTNVRGGGMYNYSSSPTVTHVIFNANSAQESGGGMYNYSSSPTLTHVTFSANSSFSNLGGGGGMLNWTGSSPTLVDVTFNGNSAYAGGGMDNSTNSNPSLSNVTFSGNSASVFGGGMFNYYSSPTLTNITFNGNSAYAGGAIKNSDSNPIVQNSILWGNTGGQISDTNSTPTVRDSIVQGGYTAGTNIITNDPLLGTFGNYSGSTRTLPLLPGSSAINAGNATYCTLGHDQRNVNYVGICDIGAFESQGFVLTKTGGDNQSTRVNTPFALPLTFSISANVALEPVNGGKITFSAPATGASVASVTQTATVVSGAGSVTQTANGSFGSYLVTASASGANSVTYALSNTAPPLYAIPTGLTSGACESWATACELQYALSTAIFGQEIWAAAGIYHPGATGERTATFQLKNGVALYGGFAGTESSRDARNWNTNLSILSGDLNDNGRDANDSYHVVTGSGTDATAVLDGFTISGGYANSSAPNNTGAGMYIQNGTPTLRHLIFSGNATGTTNTFAGGGLYIANSSPTLSDLIFSNNYAYNGAGMYLLNSSPSMTRAAFRANQAGSAGGGLYNASASAPTLTNVIFTGNSASAGAGVYNSASAPKLYNVSFAGNTGTVGAALRNQSTSHPVLKNVIIWGNSGTAIADASTYNDSASVSNSIIQGGYGGASNVDPLFVDANGIDEIYGTGDDDLHLTFGSPAIEAGTNTVCPSGDLDGLPRPNDGNADGTATCDMGAYEAGEMICAAPFTFANQSSVSIQTTTPGNLACLYIDEMEVNHPNATTGLQIGRYWLIRGLQSDKITPATGFSVTLTLPSGGIPDSNDKVCRYTGSGKVWDCALTSFDADTQMLTRAGVTAFSDWTVGNANPTSVTLHTFSVYNSSSGPTLVIFGLLAGLVLSMEIIHQHTRR